MLALLLLQSAPEAASRLTLDFDAMRGSPSCIDQLPRRRTERRVVVRCRLDSAGAPTECVIRDEDPTLTPAYRAEAICIAQSMRLKDETGARVADRTLNLPVWIRMMQPPPPGFVPPPVD